MVLKALLRFLSKRKKKPAELQAESAEMVDAISKLVRQPEWNQYCKFLDAHVSAKVQALLAGGSDAEVHRLRGYIQGLLHSVQLAEDQVQQSDNVAIRKQRDAAADSRRADAASASLYATGHWGN
jgi:hypothetical protein